ncbi:MAG: hypothetical protein ACOCRO_07770 [Halanaerobiales bacterium]
MDINFPALARVLVYRMNEKAEYKIYKDIILLDNERDIMNVNKAIKEGLPHAEGNTVTTLQNGIIDTGNIKDIDYNSITQYQEENHKTKKFIVFIKKEVTNGSMLVAPSFAHKRNNNGMFPQKGSILVGVYKANTVEEALSQAAEEINVNSEVLEVYQIK